MYANQQITELFSLIEAIQGSDSDTTSGALQKLRDEVTRLKTREQVLVRGSHEHRHGETMYLFLVPKDKEFTAVDFERLLVEDFESDLDECLSTETVDEPAIVY